MQTYNKRNKITRYLSPATFQNLEEHEHAAWEQIVADTKREICYRGDRNLAD